MLTPELIAEERELALELLEVTHISMWEMLRRSTTKWPDRPAVAMGDDEWTYSELRDRSLQVATRLSELGVGRGTRVAFLFHACPEWAALHYALARLGAVAVPVNLVFERTEIRHILELGKPEIVIGIDEFRGVSFADKLRSVDPGLIDGSTSVESLSTIRHVAMLPLGDDSRPLTDSAGYQLIFGTPVAEPLAEEGVAGGEDPAYIVFTSGSTAAPKAALCAHRAFLGAASGFMHALYMEPEDRFLAMLPTFHTGGVTCVLTAPHRAGACTQLLGAFDPAGAMEAIERYRCTVTVGFDTMYTKMMGDPSYGKYDTSSLRKSSLGATPAYIDRLREEWNLEVWASLYGSTESGALSAISARSQTDAVQRGLANGRPLPGMQFLILDPETGERCGPNEPGEICFRGWSRLLEYVDQPEETAAAIDDEGYFHSGDYGWLDEEGNLYFRGRYKMMIKTGGENVSEREVEIFLEKELPSVQFAQVIGVPDETWGEAVVAFVQLDQDVDSETLRAMCQGKIAKYKIPKRFYPLRADEFPTLANGRPDKGSLRKMGADLAQKETP